MLSSILLTAVSVSAVLAAPTSLSCQQNAIISGTTCTQECNTDRNGGDFRAVPAASFEECALACSNEPQCLTAQYSKNSNYCYLKSSLNGANANTNVDGVVCRQPSTATTTQAPPGSCPTAATYTAPSTGATFEYTCGLDYFGGDLRTAYGITSIQACLDECAAESQCIKVSWHQDANVCYLKNSETSDRFQAGEWAGRRISSGSSTSVSGIIRMLIVS